MKLRFLALLIVFAIPAALFAHDEHHHDFDPNEKVGTVHFPVSCQQPTQKSFERGVALLHSFWYEQARKQFREIEASDPKCAMAYWGDAMTYWHQIWEPANEEALKQGTALLHKAESLKAATERERDYIAALEEFFRDSQHKDHDARANAYFS